MTKHEEPMFTEKQVRQLMDLANDYAVNTKKWSEGTYEEFVNNKIADFKSLSSLVPPKEATPTEKQLAEALFDVLNSNLHSRLTLAHPDFVNAKNILDKYYGK